MFLRYEAGEFQNQTDLLLALHIVKKTLIDQKNQSELRFYVPYYS